MGTYNNLTQTFFYGKELKCFNRVYYKKDNVNTNLLVDNKKYDVIKYEWDDSEGWDYESYEITGEYPELEKNNKKEMKNIEKINEIPNATEANIITKQSIEDVLNDAIVYIYNNEILPAIQNGDYSTTYYNDLNENSKYEWDDYKPRFEKMDLIKKFLENKGYKCKYGTSIDGRNESYENEHILHISWK